MTKSTAAKRSLAAENPLASADSLPGVTTCEEKTLLGARGVGLSEKSL